MKLICLIRSHVLHESDNSCEIKPMFNDKILAFSLRRVHRSIHRMCSCTKDITYSSFLNRNKQNGDNINPELVQDP